MVNTYSHKYEKKWWRALYDNNAYRAGDTLATSLNLYYPPDDLYKYIFLELNLLGDPGLHLWTKDPVSLSVTHAPFIPPGLHAFSVNVTDGAAPVENALVCLLKENEVYEYGTTDAFGDVALSIHPLTEGDLTLTVTAQNHKHYQTSVTVSAAPFILEITPRCGREEGLTPVTVMGANFTVDPVTSVYIGGSACTDVQVLDPGTLTCLTPSGTNGWHDVEAENSLGSNTLLEGFRYYPAGGLPFNGTDVHTESLDTPAEVTLIASGKALKPFNLYYAFSGGPMPTPYGIMGLDPPVYFVLSAYLSDQGDFLLPLTLPSGFGELDIYLHLLGVDEWDHPAWAYGGNNPNGSGSVWLHLNQ
jgi:hypothetical protein